LNAEAKKYERDGRTVNYQMNPLPNWGPAARARSVKVGKDGKLEEPITKRKSEDGEEVNAKRVKVDAAVEVDEEAMMNA
jgi:tRNA (guanine26-N2/guanine27-N2)-dimethyltransferase